MLTFPLTDRVHKGKHTNTVGHPGEKSGYYPPYFGPYKLRPQDEKSEQAC